METPIREKSERIAKISQKLNSIQDKEMTMSRASRVEQEELKIKLLEDGLSGLTELENKRYNTLKEELNHIQRLVDEEKQQREFMYETKLRELEGIDERLEVSLNNSVNARKESERRLIRYIEDKFNTISGEVQNEFHVRETQLNNTSIGLDEEINKIGDSARVSRADREENDNIILRKVQEELGRSSNEIGKERSAREASEQAIYELLKDVVSRVKVEIDSEKKEREKTEDTLLVLLEDTCGKMHTFSQNY